MQRRRIVVVGGGASGLTVAYRVAKAAPDAEVQVLEADDRLGGKVLSVPVAGVLVDTAADALMLRAPALNTLITDLGLREQVRPPSGGRAWLWTRGKLRPIPSGAVFGIPDRIRPLLRSRVLGPFGLVRAAGDLVLPRTKVGPDPTVADLLRPRIGKQAYERIVDALLGGVHAGRADRLSARSAVPEVAVLLEGKRSAFLTVRAAGRRRAAAARSSVAVAPAGPVMANLAGGVGSLVDGLAKACTDAGVLIRTSTPTESLCRGDDGWVVRAGGQEVQADDVVLATSAPAAAQLLTDVDKQLAATIHQIEHCGVATVLLGYDPATVTLPEGTGFLVPPVDGRLLVGCSWLTSKWPHLGGGNVVVRAMVGRDGDARFEQLDDDTLVARIRAELEESIGLTADPLEVYIRRIPDGMPQYTVGHADRLAVIDAALADLPGLHLTGAGYRGVGLSGCVAAAETVAQEVLSR